MFSFLLTLAGAGCQKGSGGQDGELFASAPLSHNLSPVLAEVSGMADSKANPGYLWVHEDSGRPPQVSLVGRDGVVARSIPVKGLVNRDWEDMALWGNEIYVAETGDNNQVYGNYHIYRFTEPLATTDTVRNFDNIRFVYADAPHDAEALLVDEGKNIFVITKRDSLSRIYQIAAPYSLTSVNTAVQVATLPYSGVVSAAMNESGTEIIIKTYDALYYYTRSSGESIQQAIQRQPRKLAYQPEPQGEAVAFARDGSGFFTLSEKAFSNTVKLNFYKRN